eukprot:5531513-Pyramimonas_sp.AAC.2
MKRATHGGALVVSRARHGHMASGFRVYPKLVVRWLTYLVEFGYRNDPCDVSDVGGARGASASNPHGSRLCKYGLVCLLNYGTAQLYRNPKLAVQHVVSPCGGKVLILPKSEGLLLCEHECRNQ